MGVSNLIDHALCHMATALWLTFTYVPLTTMSVKPLGEALRSSLLSGVAVTSLVQCVEELVYNSIDAGSSCIAVRLDISKYKVQVYN